MERVTIVVVVVMLVGTIVAMCMVLASVLHDKRNTVIDESYGVMLSFDSVDNIYYIYTEHSAWAGMHDQTEAEQLWESMVRLAREDKVQEIYDGINNIGG